MVEKRYKRVALFIFLMLAMPVVEAFPEVIYETLARKYVPQCTPYETVQLELDLLSQGMYCYDLPMFDPDWRKRGKRIIRSARYKYTAQKFTVPYKVYKEGDKAIVYYPQNTSEGPDFLYKTNEGWILDRTAVWKYIHYNYSNTGWFAYEGDYPYLKMLQQIFPMARVQLKRGNWAYQIKKQVGR